MSLTNSPSSLLKAFQHHLSLAFFIFSAMFTTPHLLQTSLLHVSGQLSLSLLSTCPHHLSLASVIFSAMSTTPHLLLTSSLHNVSGQLSLSLLSTCPHHLSLASFIFSAMSTTPHLLLNFSFQVFDQFSSSRLESVYTISALLPCGACATMPITTSHLHKTFFIIFLTQSKCYDLRFPELSLSLAQKGADILTYPSAFTFITGAAHWEVRRSH